MKLTKLTLISVVTAGAILGAASPALADVTYPQTVDTNGVVQFKDSDGKPAPVDPTDPDPNPVEPEIPAGTSGLVRLDQVPTLDFGTATIRGTKETQGAKYVRLNNIGGELRYFVPAYVQVTDERGTNAGWNVKVKASEFKAYDGDTLSEDQAGLVGATISFKNAHVNNHSGMTAPEITQYSPVANEVIVDASATSTDKVLLDAAATKGMGIWSTSFFDAPAGTAIPTSTDIANVPQDASIELAIPGTAQKSKDFRYESTLTWTISDTPA